MSIDEIIARRHEQQALDAGSPPPAPASLPAPEFEADPDEQPEQSGVERIIAQRRAREQSTALSIHRAVGVEPESRKKALILAEEFGAPLYLVEGNLPKFEQRYKEKRVRQIAQRMPAVAAELNDPSAPAVLEDAELLADLDERLKPPEIDMGLLARGPEAARRQARSIRQSTLGWKIGFDRASEEERAEYEYLRANQPTPLKNRPGPWDEIVEATGGILPYALDVGVAGAEGYAVGATAGAGIGALAGGVPGALAGAQQAGSAAAKGAALYRITQIEGGGIYDSLRDIADEIKAETGQEVPPAVIQGMMATGGITNGMLESFALGRFAKMFPGGKFVLAKLARPQIKAALLDVTKRSTLARVGTKLLQGIEATGTNAVQEGLQGLAPRIAARALTRAYLDPNAPLWTAEDSRGVVEDAIMGAAGGFGISALGAGSSAISRVVVQPFESRAALARLDHQVEKANESKLAAQSPEVFRRMMSRINSGRDGDRTIFVAPDALIAAVGPERIAALPELSDQIAEATVTRGEVAIRLEDYLTDLREFHQALGPHVRVGLSGASQQEIGFAERVAAELAAVEEGREALTPAEQSSEQIYSFMFEAAVRDGKMSIEEARAHATTFQQHITTLAAEVGEDPWAFFQANVPLRVAGPPARAEVTTPSLATRLKREDMASTLQTLQTGQTPLRFPSFPVLDILKRNGGVDPASTLAGELRNMGVTAQSHPGVYRQGGLESLDDLDVADEPVLIGHVRIADGDYRADPNDLLDAIDKELRGQPLRSEEQIEAIEAVEAPARELGRHLDELGIDPKTVTVEQVLELLQRSGVHRPEAGEVNVEDQLDDGATTFEQNAARGSLTFDPEFRDVVIRLTQSRDASTFIHESGHLFLELMLRTAERPDASQRLRDNATAALAWLGAGSRQEITREMHEQFARGYEAYLLEGKAPSLALRDTFARFTTWLLRVYRSMKMLNVTLTDDIRSVFDRMLASDEAIAEARRVQGFMPAFNDAQTAGMTEAEFAAYELAAQRTYDDARRNLMRETLQDLDERKTAEYIEAREQITQQVMLDVNSRPVFRARGWLSTGKVPDGTVGPALEHRKLDRGKLVALKGKGILKVFRPGKYSIWQKEGGHDPEMIARVFGFDSADRMLNALATTASRQEVIALEVEERLARRFGDVFRDGRIPELAIEASMTDAQGEFLVAELRALRRNVQTQDEREQGRELPRRVVKRAARRQIEGRKVRDLREDIYRAAEQRAAMRAAEAILKRDWQTAADEKRAELLNHYLAIEAREAREQAETDRAYLLRMGGKDARAKLGKAGHDYLAQVDALLFRFRFGPMTKAASEDREALADWIIAQEQAGAVLHIDSKLRNEAFTIDWKGMAVGELSNLADAVRSIEQQAQRKNRLIVGKQRRDFAETREQAVASIGQNTVRDVRHLDRRDSAVDAIQTFARNVHGLHTKLEALFKRLDGGKLGFMWELCFKPFADAEAAEQEWLGELSGQLEGIFKKLRKAEGSWRGKVFVPEINQSLSYEKLIVIALNQGNEYNKNALLEGEGWNQQQVDAVLDLLTEADWTAVREIAALVESLKERSFALHERLSGVRPESVEPSEVITRFGVFSGWYWPLKADSLRSHVALKREEAQSAQDLFQGNAFKPMTRQGHLIARTDFGKQPVLLSLSVLSEHLYNVVHDVTHREALIQVDRITQDPAVAGAITDAVGREMYQQIRPWLQGIAGERLAPIAALDSFLGRIRQGVSISYMGLKASVLLSQSLGVFQAMGPEGVGPVRFISELQKFLTNPLEAQRRVKMALALSPALRARLSNFDRDARDAVKRGIFATSRLGEAHADFVQFAMGAIGLADMMVTVPTWLAAYGRALELEPNVERAVAEADSVVRITMGAGGAKDLAAIQRGGELQRTLTGFYSAMSAIYNQFGLTIAAIRDGRMSLPEVALAAMFMWILPALAQPLLARQGPDDDESLWKWAFTEVMFFPASLVIGLRDAAGFAERRVKGEYSDLSLPALDALETSVNATIGAAVDLAANGELSRKNTKDIVNAVGVWGHLPSRQAWITVEALYDLAYDDGDVDVMKGDLVLARPPERRAQ